MQQKLSVLIIDDDLDDRLIFCEIIAEISKNISCLAFSGGAEALEKLEKMTTLPDFIFLDLNMPRMSGKQCLIHLKNNPKLQSVPVVIYSTSKQEEAKQETSALGAHSFLSKPSRMEDLKKELRNIFQGKFENANLNT
jgi:CheY-like chemotaxis protein